MSTRPYVFVHNDGRLELCKLDFPSRHHVLRVYPEVSILLSQDSSNLPANVPTHELIFEGTICKDDCGRRLILYQADDVSESDFKRALQLAISLEEVLR